MGSCCGRNLDNEAENIIQYILSEMKIRKIEFSEFDILIQNNYEIKENKNLKDLPVIILSTSGDLKVINRLYTMGALRYICKPHRFDELKDVISQALVIVSGKDIAQATRENFVISPVHLIHGSQ